MDFISKTVKIGGSLMITVPKHLVKLLNLHANEPVKIDLEKIKESGFGLYKGIGSFTKKDELHLSE